MGTFDGVHLGHQKILQKITNKIEDTQFENVVLTFFPHPRKVLQGKSEVALLNTIDEKIHLLEHLDIQNLVIHPFDEAFSKVSAEEFVKNILVDRFNIHKIVIGYDHRFGSNRNANIDDLVKFGEKYDFLVEQISAQEVRDVSISSTKIRKALSNGNITLANEYLGYNYFLTGNVVLGKQLGRTIGFPTANIKVEDEDKLIPKNGAYLVRSIIDYQTVFGLMNIGTNPTLGPGSLSIEVHFLNLDKDLYGQTIRVHLLEYLRPEKRFDSVLSLQEQLQIDKLFSISLIKKIKN